MKVKREYVDAFSGVLNIASDVMVDTINRAQKLVTDMDIATANMLSVLNNFEKVLDDMVDEEKSDAAEPVEDNSREVMEHFIRTQWNTPDFILTGMSLDQIKSLYEAAINGARNKNNPWSGATDDVKNKNTDGTQPFGF